MIIECPYCETRFRLDERSLGPDRPSTLRCSQCRRTFALPPFADPDEFDGAEDDDGEENDAPEFSFDDTDEPGGELDSLEDDSVDGEEDEFAEGEEDEPDSDEDDLADSDVRVSSPKRRSRRGEQLSLTGSSAPRRQLVQPSLFGDDEDEYSIDESAHRDHEFATDELDDEEEYVLEEDEEEDVSQSVQVRPLLLFVALVVAGYAALTWTLRTNPDWARNFMQQLPILGSEINATRLGRAVILDELHGGYERTKEGKLIFVVTGQARNEHDEPLRDIRVELQLLDENGAPVAKQATTCGNAMRADLVRELTEEQVAILRGWGTKPPAETSVNPGASCPIVSIFLDVPDNISEFSGEVVQARRLS